MVVDPHAEEGQLAVRGHIARREPVEVSHQVRFPERWRHVELPAEAHAGGNLLEEVVERVDAYRREHRVAVVVRLRQVARRAAHCSATWARYASASISVPTSDGSDMRIRTSQPSP